jgi:hypothetical protein
MTNFILPYSQKHILINSVHDDPFILFDCLRFFHDKITKLSIAIDRQNAVSFKLFFDTAIELDQNFFFQFPMSLMSAKTMTLSNSGQSDIVELCKLLDSKSNQRFFELGTEFQRIDRISFEGLYPSKVPSKLANYNEIEEILDHKKLLQLPPGFEARNIEVSHFGNDKKILQYCNEYNKETDLQIKSKSSSVSLLIKTHTSKKRISSLDFNHPTDKSFARHFENCFSEHLSKLLSFELYIWNDKHGSISKEPRADAESKKFLNDIHAEVIQYLDSDAIQELERSIREQKLLAAVNLLDKRKDAIAASTKVETAMGFRFKVPSNEYETVILFSAMVAENSHPFYHFELHEYASSQGIDSISTYKIRQTDVAKSTQATEFEYKLSNFFKHGHPVQHTEIIICWVVDTCPYEVIKTEFPWLYKLNIDGHDIPVVEMAKFPKIKVIS